MTTTNGQTNGHAPGAPLLSFKEVKARFGCRDNGTVRKILSALEDCGKIHRFQPTKRVHPRWYAAEIDRAIQPPKTEVAK